LVSDLFTEEVMEARSRFICCIFVMWWVSILLYFTLHRSFFSLATFPWPLDRIVLSFISLIHVVGWFLHPCVARSRGPKKVVGLRICFWGDLHQRCTSISLLVKHGHEVDLLSRKLAAVGFEFISSRNISLASPPLRGLMWLGRGRWPFDLFPICEEVNHIICDEICECDFLRQLLSNNDFWLKT
jgi:hypothetical protein